MNVHESKLLKDIRDEKHTEFLSELLYHYVDKQGLGGIPKPDLDALIIYLYVEHNNKNKDFDAFSLGQKFMIKESRVKSLYETGLIKYSGLTEGQAWIKILTKLITTKFELESIEKGQIRFKFENPALFKFFQKRLRVIGRIATLSSPSETITISLEALFELLNHVNDDSQAQFFTPEMDEIHKLIEPVIQQIGSSLGEEKLKELKEEKSLKTKAGMAFASGAKLASIGSFVAAVLPPS